MDNPLKTQYDVICRAIDDRMTIMRMAKPLLTEDDFRKDKQFQGLNDTLATIRAAQQRQAAKEAQKKSIV